MGTVVWSEIPAESWVGFKEDALDEEDESFHRPFMVSDTMSQKIEEAWDSKV